MGEYTLQETADMHDMLAHYPLLRLLNPQLTPARYEELIRLMLHHNYRMVRAFDASEKCVGLSGFWIGAKLYSGKYLEIDNFVVDDAHRGSGVGKLLLDWMQLRARQEGCEALMLDAYVTNSAAHRFYFREGFQIKGYHFYKTIHA
ncbi:GNAT family N-acetyltransferase [Pontibacter anaerobius]|uniref:GNAT family N-acetyltransferase n=1 Tax=Pontibacter anaerobius TaxID=2993940 RepID=A0ABT3RGS5_9BACT|nr:GNAT family N-acetyltransferase [Pontibacter anaerobius]MCX2740646.1 GNAT family N-acetyltransferase [Pontibacter anaerobius]